MAVEDGAEEVAVAGEPASGLGFDAAESLDVAGRFPGGCGRQGWRGGLWRRRRSRGNVSDGFDHGADLVAAELVEPHVDDDQRAILARTVLGSGPQEPSRDIEDRIGRGVSRRGVGISVGPGSRLGSGLGCGPSRWWAAELVLGGGDRRQQHGGFLFRQSEAQVDGAVLALGPGQAAVALLVEPGAGGGAIAGDGPGELRRRSSESELAQLGVIDQIDHSGGFADLRVRQTAFPERLTDRGHPTQGAGDANVFASGAGRHGAGPGQPVREGRDAVPPADGVAGVELADQLQQLTLRLRRHGSGRADLPGQRIRRRLVERHGLRLVRHLRPPFAQNRSPVRNATGRH